MKQRYGTGPENLEQQNPMIPRDMAHYILDFLPVTERVKARQVCKTWKNDVDSHPFWQKAGAKSYEEFVRRIKRIRYTQDFYRSFILNPLVDKLKERVYSGEYTLELAERIYTFWMMGESDHREMNLPYAWREPFYQPGFSQGKRDTVLSDVGIMHVIDGTINIPNLADIDAPVLSFFLQNKIANQGLRQGLVSLAEANLINQNNLPIIFSKEQILNALKAGFITMQDLAGSSTQLLNLLFQNWHKSYLWDMLENQILTLKQMNALSDEKLQLLDSERAYIYLRDKIFDYYQLRKMSENDLLLILSEAGELALIAERFCVQDIFEMQPGLLSYVLSDNGLQLTNPSAPILTLKQIKNIPSVNHARILFSDAGVAALLEGLIDFDTARKTIWQRLEILLNEKGLEILREGYFDVKDLIAMRDREALAYVMSGAGKILFQYQFIDLKDHIYSTVLQLTKSVETMEFAVSRLYDYVQTLSSLNLRLPSKNNNTARAEKGREMKSLFFSKDSTPNDVDLVRILSDEENLLLQNSSKLPFNFFKIKSAVKGYRNPFLKNRLCESESEARLVQLQAAVAA